MSATPVNSSRGTRWPGPPHDLKYTARPRKIEAQTLQKNSAQKLSAVSIKISPGTSLKQFAGVHPVGAIFPLFYNCFSNCRAPRTLLNKSARTSSKSSPRPCENKSTREGKKNSRGQRKSNAIRGAPTEPLNPAQIHRAAPTNARSASIPSRQAQWSISPPPSPPPSPRRRVHEIQLPTQWTASPRRPKPRNSTQHNGKFIGQGPCLPLTLIEVSILWRERHLRQS